jgi:hypothetical protein
MQQRAASLCLSSLTIAMLRTAQRAAPNSGSIHEGLYMRMAEGGAETERNCCGLTADPSSNPNHGLF